MSHPLSCIVMGAAGRDFHDFQRFFRDRPELVVRAFTAAQIPFIAERSFPRALAGRGYEADIPIFPESQLVELIRRWSVDFVFFAYSDVTHAEVMHKQSLVQAAGAAFAMLGPRQTELESTRPVIAVTAVRTGAGKSPVSQFIARSLTLAGRRVGVVRHPMPYGDLQSQAVQLFRSPADLVRQRCTIEEREEYAPYLDQGIAVFAGVDYRSVLSLAESDSDVVLWDGGNNDYPFVRPGLAIVIADALRPGHELGYYPGETNVRAADVVVINKVGNAAAGAVAQIRANVRSVNRHAEILEADLVVSADDSQAITGRRVLVVEDGPTLTHGGMSTGAGWVAARAAGAHDVLDPRAFACGSIAEAFAAYPHIGPVLPALGYSASQYEELGRTIAASGAELVVDASPAGIGSNIELTIPVVRVRYRFHQLTGQALMELVEAFVRDWARPT